jgi:hypothetical protein
VSTQITPSPGLSIVITPTAADMLHFARLSTRRLRRVFLAAGLLMSGAGVLALSDGDPGPFVSGVLAGLLGVSLLISAVMLPRQIARRLPSFVRESRTCEIDGEGIRLRGSTWASAYAWAGFRKAVLARHFVLLSREPRAQGLALPRSAFSAEQEAQLVAILTEQRLLTT